MVMIPVQCGKKLFDDKLYDLVKKDLILYKLESKSIN